MAIEYRKDKKVWMARFSYVDSKGNHKRKSASAPTKAEAKKLLAQMELEFTDTASSDILLDDVAQVMYKELAKTRKATSLTGTMTKYRKYILPVFGSVSITKITKQALKMWLEDQVPPSLALKTRQGIFWTMHQLLDYCDKEYDTRLTKMLDSIGNYRENPNEVKTEGGVLKFWTYDQFSIISDYIRKKAMEQDPSSCHYMRYWSTYVQLNILFYCGLRRNEANALFISDFVDGEKPYLDVTKNVTRKVKGKGWMIMNPKTKNSIRKVPVPKVLAEIIRDHIETRLNFLPKTGGNIFLVGGVHPLKEDLFDEIKNEAEEACHVEHIVVHGLRHSYATTLINYGVQASLIAELLGDTLDMVLKVYAHYLPSTKDSAIEVFDKLSERHTPSYHSIRY